LGELGHKKDNHPTESKKIPAGFDEVAKAEGGRQATNFRECLTYNGDFNKRRAPEKRK